ncbi:MFS transporter [Ectothiorhodospira shaposhnikovii]|uniref:efflux RND transporter permease subunit n=1 Tax=Ectothiorhodospira shaposhnikovii TaxID=1054 RepID=UPI0019033EA4|nr:efflux RND transporter permease subunit [Ectothiorhodospira shaposhnikovii]MBK1674494.1 MFS transporter [Ectothiorhodospira shaposhnikovii]
MNAAVWAIGNGRFVGFVVGLLVLVGVVAYTQLGQLEDPEFTVRTAVVYTEYPGARAVRVEQEVTERIELKIQQMGSLDQVESYSRDGVSVIFVDIQERHGPEQLRQIWDELRHKVNEAALNLPDGVVGPFVDDEYGDVFAMLLSLTGEGYGYDDLDRATDTVRRELLRVPGVAKVEIFGAQGERVFVETSRDKIAEMGLTPHLVVQALNRQNVVAPAGFVELGPRQVRIFASGVFESLEQIRDLAIRSPVTGNLVYLRDFAEVRRGFADPPEALLRHDGTPALAIGIVPTSGVNVVDLGRLVNERLDEITRSLPVGMAFGVIADQPREVRTAINEFMVNLAMAVVIVIAVLLISLGLRTGLIVGSGVPFTILATFIAMWIVGIDLHRVSLGALVIVLGMMVDNAIVVAELTYVKMQRGLDRLDAAREAVAETAWPLLSATLIAVLAFSPIALTNTATGEFTRSLFWVVGFSLLLSWVLAITVTPVMCHRWMRVRSGGEGQDPYGGRLYGGFRALLHKVLIWRRSAVAAFVGLLIVAVLGFMLVPQIFFPPAQRAQFMVDYWLPEGSRITHTAADMAAIEAWLGSHEEVDTVTAFIGEGAPRFYLPMLPESPNPAFGQILVNLHEVKDLDAMMARTLGFMREGFPEAEPRVRPMQLGDPVRYPVMLRILGPDRVVLRDLAEEAATRLRVDPRVADVHPNWRDKTPRIQVQVDQERARRANVTSTAVAEALATAFAGQAIGVYLEDDKRIPIVWRFPLEERTDPTRVETMVIWPEQGNRPVPLLQVADISVVWEDAVIWRLDRERALTLQMDLVPGATAHEVARDLARAVEDLPLPVGYRLVWDGEAAKSADAQRGVLQPVPVVLGLMALVLMAQFNSYRRSLIILLTVPLGVVGVSAGLLLLQQPFGFMALLGVMSLSGMIIKNAIVMVEQIDLEMERAEDARQALVEAAVSRVRPVMLAALTTVLGMIPLALSGPFWAPMAIAIMFGLALASLLTLLAVPLFYAILFGS